MNVTGLDCLEDNFKRAINAFPILDQMFEEDEFAEYTDCYACGKSLLVGEDGDFNANAGVFLCFQHVPGSCQAHFQELTNIKSDIERILVLREMVCHIKPTKRRTNLVWGRDMYT